MSYKFEKLEVWQLALAYTDVIYQLTEGLPRSEEYNLKSQITRAATSIALNVAKGSTSQSKRDSLLWPYVRLLRRWPANT